MIYGRLDVYWPDGPTASYELSKPDVAIGRSPGNDVALDATAISRYHASIMLRDNAVYIQDLGSVNGTYIDGHKLPANEPVALTGSEEIQIGEIRLLFQPIDDSPTRPYLPEEVTQRIEYAQPTYRVELSAPEQPVAPGVYVQGMLLIHNMSDEQDRYFIELDGIPREWVRLERVETQLEPGEQAHLTLSFKPARRPDTAPGEYPFTVHVRSKSRPTQTVDATMMLRVLPYSGFGIDLGLTEVVAGETLPVHIHNQGNAPLPLVFSASSANDALLFTFRPPSVTLGGGQRMTVRAQVRPRRPLVAGRPQVGRFVVIAHSQDPAGFVAALPAQVRVQPLLAGWKLGAVTGGAATAILLFLAMLAALLTVSPRPQIAAFSVASTEIVAGSSLAVQWEVTDVLELHIELNGAPFGTRIPPAQTGATLLLPAPGPVEVGLLAVNGRESARDTVSVMVVPPLAVTHFAAQPGAQVRYTTRDITLSWDAPGATQVRLLGIPGETGDTAYAPTDSRLLTLDGTAPLTITLVAEGGAGQQTQAQLTLPVEDPVCRVLADATPIRTGPSDLHTIVGGVNAGTAVVPDLRDGSGQWLRLVAADSQHPWIAAAAVECLNLDPLMLGVDAAPPTAIPTATVTPSPPPTITPSPSPTPPPTATSPPTATFTPTRLPTATPPPTLTRTPWMRVTEGNSSKATQ